VLAGSPAPLLLFWGFAHALNCQPRGDEAACWRPLRSAQFAPSRTGSCFGASRTARSTNSTTHPPSPSGRRGS